MFQFTAADNSRLALSYQMLGVNDWFPLILIPADLITGEANVYIETQYAFTQLPLKEQPQHVGETSTACMDWMVEYIYRHFDAFRPLTCCAQGTSYDQFIHSMVEIEVEVTHRFLVVLNRLGHPLREIDPQLEHLLVSGMFSAFFEIVAHKLPQQKAIHYVHELQEFYTAGWKKIMGL